MRRVTAGDAVQVEANQQTRDAEVLAVVGDVALLEYRLPRGSTALTFTYADVPWQETDEEFPLLHRLTLRPCSYRSLLKRWLQSVVDQAGSWRGCSARGPVPQPQEILKRFRKVPDG